MKKERKSSAEARKRKAKANWVNDNDMNIRSDGTNESAGHSLPALPLDSQLDQFAFTPPWFPYMLYMC